MCARCLPCPSGHRRVWHTGTGRCQASLTDPAHTALGSVRFTPNGQFLLTGGRPADAACSRRCLQLSAGAGRPPLPRWQASIAGSAFFEHAAQHRPLHRD